MPIGHLSACYAKEISKQNPCYGHPLSYTKPIRDLEGRKRKVHLGDVGIFEEDGAFRRLFNITVDATHELNGGGVPVGFEPFDLSPKLVCENALSPRILCSEGVEFHEVVDPRIAAMPRWMAESGPRIAIPSTQDGEADSLCTITSNARGGAYLILRDHPTHCWIKSNRELTEYMRRNLASWHAAITDRRQFALKRRLDPEQIFLVRGTIMSSACTIGRIYGEGEIGVPRGLWERACGKVGSVVSMSCAKLGIFRSSLRDGRRERWRNSYAEISYPRDNRPGNTNTMNDEIPKDHCVFLNFYKLKRRTILSNKIVSVGDPSSVGDADGGGRSIIRTKDTAQMRQRGVCNICYITDSNSDEEIVEV